MKKLFVFAVAVMTGFAALAQQKADEVVSFDTEKYDFGKIKKDVPVITYFNLTNTSDKVLVIENAWAQCGCTTPEYSKEPIPAGGTMKIKVGYNAAAIGRFDKEVYVKLAGVQEPKKVLISGEVVDAAAYDAWTKSDEFKKLEKAKLAKQGKDAKNSKKS